MPVFDSLSVTGQGIHVRGERYADDLKQLKDRERGANRKLLDAKVVKRREASDSAYTREKQLLFHRLAQAMRHRGYDRRETAKYLMDAFPDRNKRSDQAMRGVLETLQETELAETMAQHPTVFTHAEVDAVATSRDLRQTCAMLAKTALDRRALTREMLSIIRLPAVAAIITAISIAYIIWGLGDVIKTDFLPYLTTPPSFFVTVVAIHDWVSDPLHLLGLVVGVVLFCLAIAGVLQLPPVQVRLVSALYRNSRGYGRVLHGLERRRIYTSWVQALESEGVDQLLPKALRLANQAGKKAIQRAVDTQPEGGNPLTRLRAAVPYLPAQEVALMIAGFKEGGVKATREVVEELIQEITDDTPFNITQAKDELRVVLLVGIGGTILAILIALVGAAFYAFLHLKG